MAATLNDGRVLVEGGFVDNNADPNCRTVSTADLFDPSTNSWTVARPSTGCGTSSATATTMRDGRVLIAGGYYNSYCSYCAGSTATSEMFNPADGSWTRVAQMTDDRYGHSSVLLPNGDVFVVGGEQVRFGGAVYTVAVQTAEVFNPNGLTYGYPGVWTSAGSMSTTRVLSSAVLLPNGKVMVIGGYSEDGYARTSGPPLATTEIYDPSTNSWSPGASMGVGRFDFVATVLHDGRVMVIGGETPSPGGTTPSTEFYDWQSDQWTSGPSLPQTRKGFGATVLTDGRVLVTGGYVPNGDYLASAELYDPTANSWSDAADMSLARVYPLLASLPKNEALVVGGQSPSIPYPGYTGSAERFRPSALLPGPIVSAAEFGSPSSSDPLLKRRLFVAAGAAPGGNPPAFVQYSWSQDDSAPRAATGTATYNAGGSLVDFRTSSPNANWNLFLRAADSEMSAGPWYKLSVHTPPAPLLIALGDSITSGHHKDDRNTAAICNDAAYGYPAYAFSRMRASAGSSWGGNARYINLARSGFGTWEVVGGGTDACGKYWTSRLKVATASLTTPGQSQSWNEVLITAGVDDTNWTDVLKRVITNSLKKASFGRTYSATDCSNDVSAWNGWSLEVDKTVRAGAKKIVTKLRAVDPAVRIDWFGYYNIAGTGSSDLMQRVFPTVCESQVAEALSRLHSFIRAGGGSGINWLNTDALLGNRDDLLQPLWLIQAKGGLLKLQKDFGWPHPNGYGAAQLGSLLSY